MGLRVGSGMEIGNRNFPGGWKSTDGRTRPESSRGTPLTLRHVIPHRCSFRPAPRAAFMNHSCAPSTVVGSVPPPHVGGVESREAVEEQGGHSLQRYEVYASRALQAGEELTCDYCLAEYDADEKGIDPCLCGAGPGVCLGRVRGFKVRRGCSASPLPS